MSVVDRTISLPSAMGRWSQTSATAVVSESAAHRAGLAQVTRGVLVDAGASAVQVDVDAITMDLAAAGVKLLIHIFDLAGFVIFSI